MTQRAFQRQQSMLQWQGVKTLPLPSFLVPAPATAKEGPALATLLNQHKENLVRNPSLDKQLDTESRQFFNDKYSVDE